MITKAQKEYKSLELQKVVLAFMGIDIFAAKARNVIRTPYRFFSLLSISTILLFIEVHYIINHFTDIDNIAEILPYCIYEFSLIVKLCLLISKRQLLLKLVRQIKECLKNANEEETEIEIFANKCEQIGAKIYYYTHVAAVLILFSKSLIEMFIIYMLKSEIVYPPLLTRMWPYNAQDPFHYSVMYFFSLCYTLLMMSTATVIEGLFIWGVFSVYLLMRIFQMRIGKLANIAQEDMDSFQQHIGHVIRYHQNIRAWILDFDELYCQIVFIHMVFHSINFCFFSLVLLTTPDLSFKILISFSMTILVMQSTIYCVGGQMIQNENEMASDAIYLLLPWETFDKKNMNLVQLQLMFTQRPTSITGYFFVLDCVLFVTVMRTFFSLLAFFQYLKE